LTNLDCSAKINSIIVCWVDLAFETTGAKVGALLKATTPEDVDDGEDHFKAENRTGRCIELMYGIAMLQLALKVICWELSWTYNVFELLPTRNSPARQQLRSLRVSENCR